MLHYAVIYEAEPVQHMVLLQSQLQMPWQAPICMLDAGAEYVISAACVARSACRTSCTWSKPSAHLLQHS
jgi:hypothetical protein